MKPKTLTILALALSLGATLVALLVFPERVPAHWNFRGEVDRWGSKFELLILPLIQLLLVGLMQVWPRLDPSRRGPWRHWPTLVAATAWVLTLTQLGVLYLTQATLAGQGSARGLRALWLALGLVFIVLGNYLPKAPQNWIFGVRTPWTLTNKRAWQATNRAAGWILVGFGVLLVFLALFYPNPGAVLGAIGLLLLAMLYLVWLSYAIWREERGAA